MFYKIENNVVVNKTATKIKDYIFSQNDIDLEFAVYLNGSVYDNRDIIYQKIIKGIELENKIIEMISSGYTTTLNIKAACTQEDINAFAAKQVHVDSTPNITVDIYDYYGEKHTLTQPNYLTFCYELGNYFSSIIYKRNDTEKLINDATTVEQVQAITI